MLGSRTLRKAKRTKLFKVAGTSTLVVLGLAVTGVVYAAVQPTPAPTSGGPAPSYTYTAPPTVEATRLAGVSAALRDGSKPFVIGVIGDSTGNAPEEWVGLMAQSLATETNRRVVFYNYNPQVSKYAAARPYGPDSEPVIIYNVGVPGATAEELAAKFDGLFEHAPQLVIGSVGHNQLPDEVSGDLLKFTAAIKKQWPESQTMLIAQNPALNERANRQQRTVWGVHNWALGNGVPVADVYNAFKARADYPKLYIDALHLNGEGSQLWAGVVHAALLSDAATPAAG